MLTYNRLDCANIMSFVGMPNDVHIFIVQTISGSVSLSVFLFITLFMSNSSALHTYPAYHNNLFSRKWQIFGLSLSLGNL